MRLGFYIIVARESESRINRDLSRQSCPFCRRLKSRRLEIISTKMDRKNRSISLNYVDIYKCEVFLTRFFLAIRTNISILTLPIYKFFPEV